MSIYSVLVPRQGRNYNSKKAVQEALDNGVDFTIANIMDRWDGKACNAESLLNEGYTRAQVRYGKNLTKTNVFTLNRQK